MTWLLLLVFFESDFELVVERLADVLVESFSVLLSLCEKEAFFVVLSDFVSDLFSDSEACWLLLVFFVAESVEALLEDELLPSDD